MRNSPMLKFSVQEYQNRLAGLRVQMEAKGLDAVILTSDDNTFYFSGFQSIVWDSKVSTPCVLTITRDGGMSIATSKGGTETAAYTSCVEDIRFYTRDGGKDGGYPGFAQTIASPLAEKGLLSGKIGFEFSNGTKMHLNHVQREALFAMLKDASLVDCSDALWAVRSVKSEAEIACLRRCAKINCDGIAAGFAALKEGMSELDLYRNIVIEYFKGGAERSLLLGIRAGAERYPQGNCPPSNRPIRKGEIILVDGGPICDGYYGDIIREGVIGKPSDRQRAMFNVARAACYAGIEAMKPGVRVSDVVRAVDKVMEASPFAEFSAVPGHVGHSLGTGVHEYPLLDISCDTVLQPGMVFAVEPYFLERGVGSLGIEENVLVTETGVENLTPSYSDLIVI
ncbi:MAG: Xaa-Pro peptidase family protein [Spirochaetia bacterium]|jgi:Xaa-Pro aminopeptidase|nr:Xaa-Pro peptidase family protein [Spirochaetia bacterium]